MRTKLMHSVLIAASLILFASAASTYAAEDAAMVSCKDGTQSKAGKGACSHHGGVAKSGAAADTNASTTDAGTTSKSKQKSSSNGSAASGATSTDTSTTKSKSAQSKSSDSAATTSKTSAANSGTPTAKCKDGTMSYSKHHQGACSKHGGVAQWLDQ